jgi:hypothetical protein
MRQQNQHARPNFLQKVDSSSVTVAACILPIMRLHHPLLRTKPIVAVQVWRLCCCCWIRADSWLLPLFASKLGVKKKGDAFASCIVREAGCVRHCIVHPYNRRLLACLLLHETADCLGLCDDTVGCSGTTLSFVSLSSLPCTFAIICQGPWSK